MQKCRLFGQATLVIMITVLLSGTAAAQYWFQSGARGSNDANFNNGAGVSIETVYQNATNGSMGFWVGEDLSNGAFLQVGYEVPNASGLYNANCTVSGCTGSRNLIAGHPTWFWEYFPKGSKSDSFYGGIGPDSSAGTEGSFNTYSFRLSGSNVWDMYFNNQKIGSVDLGTDNSGPNPPSAIVEYADTNTNIWPVLNVTFKNLQFYMGNVSRLVSEGYSTMSYGSGSLTILPNLYGVSEVEDYTNYFVVGSNVKPKTNGVLWKIGYNLAINSKYGNITGVTNYTAYSTVPINAPEEIGISNGIREEFEGWIGTGLNSYTGNMPNAYIILYNNITETALWQRQYYLNITTDYGNATGSGWYDANSTVVASITSNIISTGAGSREVFLGWNNSITSNKTSVKVGSQEALHAIWQRQYYLNVTTDYSNATGSGWYDANSIANVSVSNTVVQINQTARIVFTNWSNGYKSGNISIVISKPYRVNALFKKQYLIRLVPEDSGGYNLSGVEYYNVSGNKVNSTMFAFVNTTYNVEYFYYKNTLVTTNNRFSIDSPGNLEFKTPVYNIVINTQSIFDIPINTSMSITFKNNTNIKLYTGNDGHVVFDNVPYGFATGYAEYLGIRQSINLAYGAETSLTFLTISLIAFIVGGTILIVAVAKIVELYEHRRHKP